MTKKNISKEEVERIAKLARLGLMDDEISAATENLSGALEHFSKIQKIDTSNTVASDDVTGLKNVVREDTENSEVLCGTGKLLENAPDVHKGQVKVKAVFE
jgi:aspartyl-tRNA(Asn)/glutamyl-tRNA(Gln) amidotransferase subunit C